MSAARRVIRRAVWGDAAFWTACTDPAAGLHGVGFDPSHPSQQGASLKKCLSLLDLTVLGIACVVGAGIFVITGVAAREHAGPAIFLSYLFAAVACLACALCYAEFSTSCTITGGSLVYTGRVFGRFFAWIVAVNILLEYVVAAAAVAKGFSPYFCTMIQQQPDAAIIYATGAVGEPLEVDLVAAGLVLLLTVLLAWGMTQTSWVNLATTLTVLAIIVITIVTVPGALLMARVGRRTVFLGSAALAAAGAGLTLLAVYRSLYWLLIVGALLQGPGFAQANNFRFVAAEFAEPRFRARAISLVVLGGVAAAAVGPETARHARYMLPVEYAGCYVVLCCLYALLILLLAVIDYALLRRLSSQIGIAAGPTPVAAGAAHERQKQRAGGNGSSGCVGAAPAPGSHAAEQDLEAVVSSGGAADSACRGDAGAHGETPASAGAEDTPPPRAQTAPAAGHGGAPLPPPPPLLGWRELLLTRAFLLPAACCGLSFCGMAALMSVVPLVVQRSIGYDQGVWVIEAHIVAMYLPGLLTADIIKLVSAPVTMIGGALLLLGGNAAFYWPMSNLATSFVGMVLIGVGWNWAYTAASVLIMRVYEREPRRRFGVQGATDTCVLVLTGAAVGTAGTLAAAMGWAPGFVSLYMGVSGCLLVLAAASWALQARQRDPSVIDGGLRK